VKPLAPVDLARCQAERREGSFMTFGPRSMVRCDRAPVFVVTERKKGKDGRKGAMSVYASEYKP
jgi:hypothetical protein